jgi:protein-tyrosine phosphatase
MALRLLREDKIHLLGSDCHNLKSRVPNLDQALRLIEKKLGPEAIERINAYENTVLGND